MPARRVAGVAVAGPEQDHRRIERFEVVGADQGRLASQEHQVGEAATFRGAGIGACRPGGPPRRTEQRQAAFRPGLSGPRPNFLPAERRLLLAGSRRCPRQGTDGFGRTRRRQPPRAQAQTATLLTAPAGAHNPKCPVLSAPSRICRSESAFTSHKPPQGHIRTSPFPPSSGRPPSGVTCHPYCRCEASRFSSGFRYRRVTG